MNLDRGMLLLHIRILALPNYLYMTGPVRVTQTASMRLMHIKYTKSMQRPPKIEIPELPNLLDTRQYVLRYIPR